MIITTEKYKDTIIVYIDESVETIEDLPAHLGYECLRTSFEHPRQFFHDDDTEIPMTNILDFRRQRLGERRMDLL